MQPTFRLITICLVTLCCSLTNTFSQTLHTPLPDEVSFSKELLTLEGDQKAQIPFYLQRNRKFVTERLWQLLVKQGGMTNKEANFDRALFIYGVAKQVAVQLNDKKLEALSLYNSGLIHTNKLKMNEAISDYSQSRDLLKAIDAPQHLLYVLADLGALYLYNQENQRAKESSEEALAVAARLSQIQKIEITRPDAVGIALTTLGAVYKWEGNYQRAIDSLEQALTLYQSLKERKLASEKDIADVQAEMGRVYRITGNYQQALFYFNHAMEGARRSSDDIFLADVMNSVGILYTDQRDFPKAIAFFTQSKDLHAAANDDLQVAHQLLNIGVVELKQGNYKEAIQFLKESYAKFNQLGHRDGLIAAGSGIGTVLGQQGNSAGALSWLNKSLSLAEVAKDQTRIAEILWQKSEAQLAAGSYPASIDSAHRAFQIAQQNRYPNLSYLSATVLGKAYLAQKDLAHAADSFSKAIQQIEESRDYVAGAEQESLFYFDDKIEPYHKMVEVLLAQNKLAEALSYAERAKARLLLDVMRDGKADLTKVMTRKEKEEAQRLNRSVSEINERIRIEQAKTTAATALTQLYAQLDAARLKFESFQDALYVSHPDLKLKRGKINALTLDGGNLKLDSSSAYLEYVVSDKEVYLFVISKKEADGDLQIKTYPINIKANELERKVNQFRQMLADRNPVFAGAARELYELFIKPAASQFDGMSTLCIIPDSFLWDMPFQALLSSDTRYLLEDYSIYYAPSLSVLQEMARPMTEDTKQTRDSLIAFGNPVTAKETVSTSQASNNNDAICPLPEAETEVNAIAHIFGPAQSNALIGREASEKIFKMQAPAYRAIHLATHGILDNRHPLYSYLLLTKTEGEVNYDGLLEAREIMGMTLNADLAVLSACETARGKIGAGEGVIGMSWAFFMAGCRTTIVSQWKVNSSSTSQMMVSFYQALKPDPKVDARKKAAALRTAALSLMKDGRYRHPFYWASFVMVGSNE